MLQGRYLDDPSLSDKELEAAASAFRQLPTPVQRTEWPSWLTAEMKRPWKQSSTANCSATVAAETGIVEHDWVVVNHETSK